MTVTTFRNTLVAGCLCLALLAAGCAGGGDTNGNGGNGAPDSYLPLTVGNSWHYLMTLAPDTEPIVIEQVGENQLFDYHETVVQSWNYEGVRYGLIEAKREETEDYPEHQGQLIMGVGEEAVYARLALLDETGQVVVGEIDVPYLMLPPQEGETWEDLEYGGTCTTGAVDEEVTVPAGTFTCVRVEQAWEGPADGEGSGVEYVIRRWYAQGVGLVKDETWEGDAKTSMIELTEYTVR